ncbi:MAG TPA: (2Fe-2S) ferredoxin domain-containing protein [Candidatus Thermoplasmatota archaeon]|nr:(2Fe-2S) ferredoxin domain-containing protein [Candidatus Thermoplasmatota archaeon]
MTAPYRSVAFVCTTGDTCPLQGSVEIRTWLKAEAKKRGIKGVRVNASGCLNQCGHGPMLVVYPDDVWYAHVDRAAAERILEEHLVGGTPVRDLEYRPVRPGANKLPRDEATKAVLRDHPEYKPCNRC